MQRNTLSGGYFLSFKNTEGEIKSNCKGAGGEIEEKINPPLPPPLPPESKGEKSV